MNCWMFGGTAGALYQRAIDWAAFAAGIPDAPQTT